jgi:hypothetical protein
MFVPLRIRKGNWYAKTGETGSASNWLEYRGLLGEMNRG